MPKKRNPTDATMRNVSALKRRVLGLELLAKDSNGTILNLVKRMTQLEETAVARGWPRAG